MAELLVFAKAGAVGVFAAEVFRVAFLLGQNFAKAHDEWRPWATTPVIFFMGFTCLAYAFERQAHVATVRLYRSLRLDLLVVVAVGVWVNILATPWLTKPHGLLQKADPMWAPVLLLLLGMVLLSPLCGKYRPRALRAKSPLYFIPDEEVTDKDEDHLNADDEAAKFARAVLESGAHRGLVFGVDGPWGVGKTSFINLAQRYWENVADEVIVCRFEPLRYASDPDLSERLIKDLSAAIQKAVFVPEFGPAASRYSRLLKGKADFSFLGFKLSLEPSNETVDELLDDIDDVLKRTQRRVIIVIDDLDRLDPKTVNNVLFATRRTFKLSQATYVLCYDTEILAGPKEDGERAREFLEKFVMAKISLFVDSEQIRHFLRTDWQESQKHLATIPSDTMVKLGAVLNELAELLRGEHAARYLPMIGNLRKVKRFVNALLLMQLEKTNLGRTDFNRCDLIHLVLLHLNYPGLFRRIYAEEAEGRSGSFAVRHDSRTGTYKNSDEFKILLDNEKESKKFLLQQLFDVNSLKLTGVSRMEEVFLRSRACFNQPRSRNLESYLKLFVRFAVPEPRETFVLYQDAVDRFRKGTKIRTIFSQPDFRLEDGNYSHDQFWRVLVNQSHNLNSEAAQDAIETLIEYLPRYTSVESFDLGLRQRSIYSLLRLLDRAGWGRTATSRRANTPDNVVEIAQRIFGEGEYRSKPLIQTLASKERGVMGWYDLMVFRLQCSADRMGELYNLQTALIVHGAPKAPTSGPVSNMALVGMRGISQAVFAYFKETHIDTKRNFFTEVDATAERAFWGEAKPTLKASLKTEPPGEDSPGAMQRLAIARSGVKSFVIYQLGNSFPPTGSGVGCGYYDLSGNSDGGGIGKAMNEYVFGFCFDPDVDEDNVFHFLDYCLTHLTSPFFAEVDSEDGKSIPTKKDLPGGLDPIAMGAYWRRHGERIRKRNPEQMDRIVITTSYIASYREDLPRTFEVLDELADTTTSIAANARHPEADSR